MQNPASIKTDFSKIPLNQKNIVTVAN